MDTSKKKIFSNNQDIRTLLPIALRFTLLLILSISLYIKKITFLPLNEYFIAV